MKPLSMEIMCESGVAYVDEGRILGCVTRKREVAEGTQRFAIRGPNTRDVQPITRDFRVTWRPLTCIRLGAPAAVTRQVPERTEHLSKPISTASALQQSKQFDFDCGGIKYDFDSSLLEV